jgi:hypothetical protein
MKYQTPNRLAGSFAYLCGPMDAAPDGGVEWRVDMSKWLRRRGVFVLDPCDKPIQNAPPEAEGRQRINEWKELGEYDKIRPAYGEYIRGLDLRMCDKADFLVVYLNSKIPTCGTWNELFTSNQSKKPIIVMCEDGKKAIPNWMFLTLPQDMMFGSWGEVHHYLEHINTFPDESRLPHLGRWRFFDWRTIIEKTMAEMEITKQVPLPYRKKFLDNLKKWIKKTGS